MTTPAEAGDRISPIVADVCDRNIGPLTAMSKIQTILDELAQAAATAERDRLIALARHHGALVLVRGDDQELTGMVPFADLLDAGP